MTASLGTFVCKSVQRNNGITKLHFQKDDQRAAVIPQDAYFNIVMFDDFVMGRKYAIHVVPVIGDQG